MLLFFESHCFFFSGDDWAVLSGLASLIDRPQ